jgi:hypothetical protein
MSEVVAAFFMNHYNEIDHMSPVIHRWLSVTDVPTRVVLTGDEHIGSDYRIDALREFDHCQVDYAAVLAGVADTDEQIASDLGNTGGSDSESDDDGSSALNSHAFTVAKFLGRRAPTEVPERIWRRWVAYRTLSRSSQGWLARAADDIYADVLGDADRAILAYDWESPSPNGVPHRQFAYRGVQIANEHGYETVALPHGDRTYKNAVYLQEQFDRLVNSIGDEPRNLHLTRYTDPEVDREERGRLDHYVVPNQYAGDRFEPILSDTLRVLGSPRFNEEWVDFVTDHVDPYEHAVDEDTVKIAFLPEQPIALVTAAEVERTIRFLTGFPDVEVVVKAHTRLNDELMAIIGPDAKLANEDIENLEIVYNNVHTPSLLRWCDALVDMGSSAAIEAITLGVPYLHVDYAHCCQGLIADYLPDTKMTCPDDLYEAIWQLKREGSAYRSYTTGERERFIRDVVQNSHHPETPVLDCYVSFLQGLLTTDT